MKILTLFLLALSLSLGLLAPAAQAQRGAFGGATGERIEPEDLPFELGVATIPDRATYEKLSYRGPDAGRDSYLAGIEFVKFIIDQPETDQAKVYFMNTQNHRAHPPYMGRVGLDRRGSVRGALCYLPRLKAPDGDSGLYIFDFQPGDSYAFDQIRSYRDTLIAKMPLLKGKLAFHPLRGNLEQVKKDAEKYAEADLALHLDAENYTNIAFLPLNVAESYGLLRVMEDALRPSPRDIVICKTLPNQMPRVAGVITEERQTPLSHVNLRAIQDKVPNAYLEGATKKPAIQSLLGKLVHYAVTTQGYTLREATQTEVERHFAALRPELAQTPGRDLSIAEIRPLGAIKFEHASSFGRKTANLASLRTLNFPPGTVPDGFGIPFSFYHQFMVHNGFYEPAKRLIEDTTLREDREALENALRKFRKTLEAGDFPPDSLNALTELQRSFPRGTSLRCRSSSNNEDLPGFSGAGLYDSYTHKPDEGHLSNTILQVFASLWNFRAFEEREFYRIDHLSSAMGVLVHPNFKGEKANGVAVTEDILYESQGYYYLNTQLGEDLVTNPEADSSPEETLLGWYERDGHTIVRPSPDAPKDKSLLSDTHLAELRDALGKIHSHFADAYGRDVEDLQFAMEIEFKITRDDKLTIKQARPWIF